MQAQDEARLKPAAAMVESVEIRELVDAIFKGASSKDGQEDLITKVLTKTVGGVIFADEVQECKILMSRTNESKLDPFDIIADRRSVAALCLLFSSMVSPI